MYPRVRHVDGLLPLSSRSICLPICRLSPLVSHSLCQCNTSSLCPTVGDTSCQVQAPRKTLSVKQLAEQVAAAPPASAPDSFETPVANPVPERIPGTGSDAATTQGEGLRPGTPPQAGAFFDRIFNELIQTFQRHNFKSLCTGGLLPRQQNALIRSQSYM